MLTYHNENFNGTYDFRSRAHGDYLIPAHLHEYSELLFVKSGCADVCIDRTALRIPAGHLVWISPNCVHEYSCRDTQVICAVFSRDLIPVFRDLLGEREIVPCAIDFSHMAGLLERLPSLSGTDPVQISGYLQLIGARVLQCSQLRESGRDQSELYQKVISLLFFYFLYPYLITVFYSKFIIYYFFFFFNYLKTSNFYFTCFMLIKFY